MRTVSGILMSSNQVSLSKAARIMSGFTSVDIDNGASDAVCMCLIRSSDALNSLVQLHKKEPKTPIFRRVGYSSQPIVSAVKIEALVDRVENLEEKTVQKGKKYRYLEASQLVTVKIQEKRNRNLELGSNNEDAEVIDQGPNGFSGKKRKKTDKEASQNQEPLTIVQSSDRAVETQALEASHERVERKKIEYEGGVKKDKKKRKRNKGEEREKSSEVEDGKQMT